MYYERRKIYINGLSNEQPEHYLRTNGQTDIATELSASVAISVHL